MEMRGAKAFNFLLPPPSLNAFSTPFLPGNPTEVETRAAFFFAI